MPLFKCSAGKARPKNAITYITKPEKAAYVSVRNLFEDEDYAKQFEQTATMYGKGKKYDERKYYHFKLSCARKDNVSPKQAHKYAEEVAEKLFKDCECVIATHTDTQTVHSHIIVNAVNPLTGKKLQFSPKEYADMKDEVNRIGKKYGYTETDFRKRGKNSRTAAERKIILSGGTSWKEELREVIQEAATKTKTVDKFKEYLLKCYGVKITRDGKDFSYLHPQKQKPIRGERLGTNYSKKEILRKFGEQNNGTKSTANSGRSRFNGQPSGARVVRAGGFAHGGGAGKFIAEGIGCIEREMQRLNFAAECAGRGTDAASEEREIERLRRRRERERLQRDSAERDREELGTSAEQHTDGSAGVAEPDSTDTSRGKGGYGKGD